MSSKSIEKEILDLFELLEKKTDKSMKPLLQAYKKALNTVRDEMYSIWGKYQLNGELSISQDLRLSIVQDMEKKLVKMASELAELDEEVTKDILINMYGESYYRTAYEIDKVCEFTQSFNLISKELMESIAYTSFKGSMFSDRIWQNKESLVNRLRDIIETSIIQGKNSNKVAKLIAEEFGVSAYEARRLIRTEMSRVTASAQENVYQQSEVVKKVMYVATLDGKTCERCKTYDGRTWDKNDPTKPQIPIHPMTRSRYISIVDGYVPKTRADNETKETIEYKNYEDWYKNKINN